MKAPLTEERTEEMRIEMLYVEKYWIIEQVSNGKTEQEIKDLYHLGGSMS